ncbi:squalene synthase [Cantharellus anzutake]|uniref:squalene synthase n=1 Tax=Cantharellus anzutake TaxID=1750568 RepID=UPI001903AB05|nr:squalene synthase [Cantharellus anzutake]KAF8321083.1 squalene synthase [Cantharellus anzutake]
MGILGWLYLFARHPDDVRTLVQYKLWYEPKRDITNPAEWEATGYNRKDMKRCWEFLDMTSRSFASVIKELDGDLARATALFYLALRGLDTVEDDMTISDEIKQPLLRSFHEKLQTPDWCFGGSGPNEKDRQLLVEFNVVIAEIALVQPEVREVIVDITHKMENGMADYAHKAVMSPTGTYIDDIEEFDLYCHYVAGLVGEGLSRLFAATGKEKSYIANELVLSNSMGLLLQKVNILRDIREDIDDSRFFWPKSIWESHGFKHPAELRDLDKRQEAIWVLSAMTLDALRHSVDALDYLALLRNQSVFNFCAIPASMAMATLALCFMNPTVFDRNIKIRKAQAVNLIMKSTNPRDVAYMFRDYARELHAKLVPADPYFVKISIACGKIEQWCEQHYPSFIVLRTAQGGRSSVSDRATGDARMRAVERHEKLLAAKASERGEVPPAPRQADDDQNVPIEFFLYVGLGMAIVFGFCAGIIVLVTRYTN